MPLLKNLPLANAAATPRAVLPATPSMGSRRPSFQQAPNKRNVVVAAKQGGWLTSLLRSSTDTESESEEVGTNGMTAAQDKKLRDYAEVAYLTGRHRVICQHFPTAMGVDDFIHRMEIALYAYGFHGDNSIAMVNLCRDEITVTLKQKLDQVFGCAFNTNGLGGVLTCGVTGVAAGLSHAPISQGSGKERYVFFSFPHISIDATGEVGTISRPGRPGASCACGALNKALVDIRRDGVTSNCKMPGVHEPLDPEFTILKQRLARRLRYEGTGDAHVGDLSLVDITAVAERTITDDLEYLISQTVDPKKADYAVVTGIQVHNWGTRFDDDSPNLEFVAPNVVYVVVNGEKTRLDLNAMPSLTPRQIKMLVDKGQGGTVRAGRDDDNVCNNGGISTLREIDPPYLYNSREMRRRKRERAATYRVLIEEEALEPDTSCAWPSWQSGLRVKDGHDVEDQLRKGNSAIHFDKQFESVSSVNAEEWFKLQDMYVSAEPPSKNNGGNGKVGSDDASTPKA